MTLNRKSRLVKWTYVLSNGQPPDQTTLCCFFWRCFVWMPLFWAGSATIIVVISATLGLFTYWTHGGLVPAALATYVGVQYIRRNHRRVERVLEQSHDRLMDSVFVQGLATLKGKVCPIIHIP